MNVSLHKDLISEIQSKYTFRYSVNICSGILFFDWPASVSYYGFISIYIALTKLKRSSVYSTKKMKMKYCMKRKVLKTDVARYCSVEKDKQSVDSDKQVFFFIHGSVHLALSG